VISKVATASKSGIVKAIPGKPSAKPSGTGKIPPPGGGMNWKNEDE